MRSLKTCFSFLVAFAVAVGLLASPPPAPTLMPQAFGSGSGPHKGAMNTIPVASASPLFSLADGIPIVNMKPLTSGGIPPQGADFNGILNWLSQFTAYSSAGGVIGYNSAYATAIGGYPVNAVLQLTNGGLVICTSAGNTNNPNTNMAGWAAYDGPTVAAAQAAQLASTTGASLVGTAAPYTGSVARTIAAKEGESLSFADFGAVGDGMTNDTVAVQLGINAASQSMRPLVSAPGKTYLCGGVFTAGSFAVGMRYTIVSVGTTSFTSIGAASNTVGVIFTATGAGSGTGTASQSLVPMSNVAVDLQGSTIKLASGTNNILIDGTQTTGSNFSMRNGVLDMNLAGNQSNSWICGGGAWFTGWQFVRFDQMIFQNAYMACLYYVNCSDIFWNGIQCLNCGLNTNGKFGYAIKMDGGCRRITGSNLYVNTMYGFGLDISGVTAANVSMTVSTTAGSNSVSVTAATGTIPGSGGVAIPGFATGTTISSVTNGGVAPCTMVVNNNAIATLSGKTAITVAAITSTVEDIDISNCWFNNLTYGGNSICCTLTVANRVHLKNFKCFNCDGILIECNASNQVSMRGMLANGCGLNPLLLGDNGTGIPNTHLLVDDFVMTGTTATYAGAFNDVQDSTFSRMSFDKAPTTLGSAYYNYYSDRGNVFTDCTFAVNIPSFATFYNKWALERCSFSNVYVEHMRGNTARFTSPLTNGLFGLQVANSSSTACDLYAWNILGATGSVMGRFVVSSKNVNNATGGTYQEVIFAAGNGGNTLNLGTPAVISLGTVDQIAISATTGAGTSKITMTNSTGVTLAVSWACEVTGL